MRLYSSESFWSIAQLWYMISGLVALSLLGNGLQHGFGELRDIVSRMTPVSWLILAVAFAPGPIAHWLANRVKD
jgi:hypothetical protein